MFRSVVSTNSKTGALCAVTGNVSCSKELSKDTSTSGFEKMSRLDWIAGLGIMCVAAVVVVVVVVIVLMILILMREAKLFLTVKASFGKCQSFCVFESFLLLLLLFDTIQNRSLL